MKSLLALISCGTLSIALGDACLAAQVSFDVELNPVGNFTAEAKTVKGSATQKKDNSVSAENIVLELNDFHSGVDLRDKHMKDKYFEVARYPQAILKHAEGSGGRFKGQLELHGQSHDIEGSYTLGSNASDKTLDAVFSTKMSDFKIAQASYMGVGVADDIKVHVSLPLVTAQAPK